MPSLFSDNVLGFKSRAGKQRARSYNSEGILRRRKQQQQARRFFRFSFRNFAVLLLLLGALTISPSVYFYFVENPNQGCAWLQRPPIICAHGGDSSDAPPNTRAAYQLALDAEVECIEIDASRTRDGFLVALHDRDLQTMSGRPGIRVGDLTLDQIKQLNASRGFLHKVEDQIVQTLEDAIKFVQRPLKQVIIDAKVGPPLFEQQLGVDIISLLRKTKCTNCVVWAKQDFVVADIIHRSKHTKTGYIVLNDTATGKVSELIRFEGSEIVGIYYGLVNSKVVMLLHRARKKVHAWTVDNTEGMVNMLKAGVDAIITSNPRLLQRVMQNQRQLCSGHGFA